MWARHRGGKMAVATDLRGFTSVVVFFWLLRWEKFIEYYFAKIRLDNYSTQPNIYYV
jgi:hypothetical protein